MAIEQADWKDILEILRETCRIWSVGLPKDLFYDSVLRQMTHPWGRRNYRYMVYRENGKIVSSLKLYQLHFSSRGQCYKFAGIGALYTQESCRSRGYASDLLKEIIRIAATKQLDGIILFSDIDPSFYKSFGFQELGGTDFSIPLSKLSKSAHLVKDAIAADTTFGDVSLENIGEHHIPFLEQQYSRWLAAQPFGVVRTSEYWRYKLQKEEFMHNYSRLCWPRLRLISVKQNYFNAGYAIIEYGGRTLRILELIGAESARTSLWQNIFQHGYELGAERIQGWISVLSGIEPGFSLSALAQNVYPSSDPKLKYIQRHWGRPMILPRHASTVDWLSTFPCPILELDHL